MFNEKKIVSGKLLEVDIYPCWSDGRAMPVRVPKQKRSTVEQEKYNRNQAIKKSVHLINANFDDNDYILVLTFHPSMAPQTIEELTDLIRNYINRLRRRRKSELKRVIKMLKLLPDDESFERQRKELLLKKSKLEAPLKYYYTREMVTYQRGEYKGKNNFHAHIFITGGIDRNEMEELWPYGSRCNADRFQPHRFGPEAMAKYMMKDPQGAKSYICSKNLDRSSLIKPKVKPFRMSPGNVAKTAQERETDREYWEKKYKGYRFIRCYSRYNEHNGQWYISVIMYRNDKVLPEWKYDDWIVW